MNKTNSLKKSQLLEEINLGINETTWQQYQELKQKRQVETLTRSEYETLITISNQIETANAQRIEALTKLAALRRVSLENLMEELGLVPPLYE